MTIVKQPLISMLSALWQSPTNRCWSAFQWQLTQIPEGNLCIKDYYDIYFRGILFTSLNVPIMDLKTLFERCQNDTNQYKRGLSVPSDNCFELMRRALADDDNLALTHLYSNYRQLLMNWVLKHPGFSVTGEDPDYFMSGAFANFYFALRNDKFQNFASLAKALAYLKSCVHTVILQYIRKNRLSYSSLDDVDTKGQKQDYDRIFRVMAIWERITQLLPDDKDQKLAYLIFVQERKPVEIAQAFPDIYPDARTVSVARQRIRRILQQDDQLRDLLGGSEDK